MLEQLHEATKANAILQLSYITHNKYSEFTDNKRF